MDIKVGDRVDLIVVRKTALGYTVLIDEEFEGLLYKSELYKDVFEGDRLTGYIKKLREDGKIDVSLQPVGYKHTVVANEIKILNALKENEGFLPLHDKSTPEEIKLKLQMSKKAFKNAVGGLYKQKLITISTDGIQLK